MRGRRQSSLGGLNYVFGTRVTLDNKLTRVSRIENFVLFQLLLVRLRQVIFLEVIKRQLLVNVEPDRKLVMMLRLVGATAVVHNDRGLVIRRGTTTSGILLLLLMLL